MIMLSTIAFTKNLKIQKLKVFFIVNRKYQSIPREQPGCCIKSNGTVDIIKELFDISFIPKMINFYKIILKIILKLKLF